MKNWRSTAAGILSGLIGTLTSIMTFQVPAALMSPKETHIWLWVTVSCNLAVIVARVWLGVVMNDPESTTPTK